MDPSTEIRDGGLKQAIVGAFFELLGTSQYHQRNPAPLPVSLERRHCQELLQQDYMVSDKSDGTRYVLFLVQVKDTQYAVLIDRKLSLHQVPVAAARSHFKGSIYDGELVTSQDADAYLVFDCFAHKGEFVGGEDYCTRLSLIRGAMDLEGCQVSSPEEATQQASRGKVICGGSRRGLQFRPKPCFQLRQLDTLLRKIPLLPYATDGLIFTPVHAPISFGTWHAAFKFKTSHSIDAEVSSDGARLLIGVGGAPERANDRKDLAALDAPLTLAPGLEEQMRANPGAILELGLTRAPDPSGSVGFLLTFLHVRKDKAHPNTVYTIQQTLASLGDNITTAELLEIAREAGQRQDLRSTARGSS